MVSEKKLRNSFTNVRRDIDVLKYATLNNVRYLNTKVKEQGIRIRELERRLAQIERVSIQEIIR